MQIFSHPIAHYDCRYSGALASLLGSDFVINSTAGHMHVTDDRDQQFHKQLHKQPAVACDPKVFSDRLLVVAGTERRSPCAITSHAMQVSPLPPAPENKYVMNGPIIQGNLIEGLNCTKNPEKVVLRVNPGEFLTGCVCCQSVCITLTTP